MKAQPSGANAGWGKAIWSIKQDDQITHGHTLLEL